MNVFITGTSKGLGRALAIEFTKDGHLVSGLSRTLPDIKLTQYIMADLASLNSDTFKDYNTPIDLLILNAGILGGLVPQSQVTTQDTRHNMEINVFSQKTILDAVLQKNKVKRVIAISSGAANKCRYGWGNYALCKASLKMLMHIYAVENPDIHFLSVAPGLIDTDMQQEVRSTDEKSVPGVVVFRQKKEKNMIDSPETVAQKIIELMDELKTYESGSFIDLREL